MQKSARIMISLMVAAAVMNGVLAILGKEVLLHLVTALNFSGWALEIRAREMWRARALLAERVIR